MTRAALFGAIVACLAACESEYHPEYHPETTTSVSQTINYGTIVTSAPRPGEPTTIGGRDWSRVIVLQGTHLDRPAEVVGVIDAHLPMGDQDAALAALKRRAAQMGADAVVGVEFHHGDGPGEPIHLSGLAVRFLATLPLTND